MLKSKYYKSEVLIEPEAVDPSNYILLDCRFSLSDPDFGRRSYNESHVPGAFYLDLKNDLSAPVGTHGGRHPLPEAKKFLATLARCGIGSSTAVVVYDDSKLAFASRLWWMMKSIGYRPPKILNGGYQAWVNCRPELDNVASKICCRQIDEVDRKFSGVCDFDALHDIEFEKCSLIDSREYDRYLGLIEPIDPVAGHIPGAINRPWTEVTDGVGRVLPENLQRERWRNILRSEQIVVYCGSGVTACVNLFSLHLLGRDDAILYGGSWSDWCSYL